MNGRCGVLFNDDDIEENGKGTELPACSFNVLTLATNNFSKSNLLGEGGFGPVYKLCLHVDHISLKENILANK